MTPRLNPRKLRRLAAACVALFLVLSVIGLSIVRIEESQRQAAADRLLVAEAAEIRAALGDRISQNTTLARGLRAFVVANPDLGPPSRFDTLLEQLYEQGEDVRNIGVAPGNVLSKVYPVEGNEGAIGLRYEDIPEQFAAVELAMRTGQSVLAGPVDLVQGGRGLIDRTPVFLPDGTYWGVVSLVLDVDGLLDGMETEIADLELDWAIRTVASDTLPVTTVGGEPAVFDDASVVLSLAVPNGTWELAVRSNSTSSGFLPSFVVYGLAIAIAALLSWLVFERTHERWRAKKLSLLDHLTGVANRRLLQERAERAFADARRRRHEVSFAYIDLDAFKPINDSYGHEAGDEVLRVVAQRLRERVRECDTVARVGGDEFVILLPATDIAGAQALVDDMVKLIEQPVMFNGTALEVGASFGVASYPKDGETFDELLADADSRMYEVKRRVADPADPEGTPEPAGTDLESIMLR